MLLSHTLPQSSSYRMMRLNLEPSTLPRRRLAAVKDRHRQRGDDVRDRLKFNAVKRQSSELNNKARYPLASLPGRTAIP
ncbi:hypothetical protein EVAR_59077_1 [Eumeta japonica]|uniref:Uncharacterized protein n=1 Tax=Eumeta variegata TaxID=151549 RepID=A0A4C1YZL8_EUMVA|nr:hypothetical protein EVAR_59077_1 [Eumeta japonica]